MKQTTGLIKNFIGSTVIALLLSLNCAAQVDNIQRSFDNYRQTALHEKVFAHTDKPSYLTGEIIWFKLYVVDGTYHKPLDLSKVAYVDVLDNNQVPVMQTKVEVRNGKGNGSIYIPVTLSNGNYRLRAYTNWMKNFSPEYYFEKTLTIVNPQIGPGPMAAVNPAAFDVQFFPEGGNLVSDLNSKVAFKAVGKDGKGVDVSGAVINSKNDTVARFKSTKFGMGSFMLKPDAGTTYKAVLRAGTSAPVTKDLPAANSQGYVMQLTDNNNGQLTITVNASISNPGSDVYLFTHTRQSLENIKRVTLNNGLATFTVDKSSLGDGVSHLTVFNSDRAPVCERLYFKRPAKTLAIDAAADSRQYGNRKKVNISVSATENADLSMSVYRLDNFQTADASDIVSYLYLGSDLRGSVESPGYYLNNNTAEANEAADNLMLTQGWRRFQWNDVLNNKPASFSFLPEYNGHLVTGKLINTTTNAPATDVVAYFAVPGKRVQLFAAKSDTGGRLLFNTKDFYGPGEIVVQTNTQHDSTFRIDVTSPFSEQYAKTALPPFYIGKDMQQSLENSSLGMQVLNIYSGDNIRKYYTPAVDSNGFFGKPYKSYKLDDYTRFTTMEEVLREYIRELYVVRQDKKYHIKIISERGFLEGDPLVMLDGIPVFDMDKVIALDPLKIRRLDVMRERYFWGPADAEGILSYTTYKGDLGGVEIDPHAVVLDYEGLQLQRVFYSPTYDTEAEASSRLPDFRNLLYWSPSIKAGPRGNNQLSFYTSDQQGQYMGVIQGITANGTPGVKYINFEVKK